MKTFLKSFSGAALATILILAITMLIVRNADETADTGEPARYQVVKQYQQPPAKPVSYPIPQGIDFSEAAEKTVNAVVHIMTEMSVKTNSYDEFFGPFRHYFGYPNRRNTYVAFGSGVIITSDGYIVTNNHVVEGADKITVTFNDKNELEATLIGRDPSTDLALIKVDEENLEYLSYGDSDELKIGEWVLAVGNPFNLTSTVTAGIVSAKARNIDILGGNSSIESFIQTDAVVNRGNSGGALVNVNGQLVGINAAIASHTGVYEGYSFAVPVNIVRKVASDLMNYGETQRAYIGVQIRDIDANFAKELDLKEIQGIYVASVVENGGAEEAGLQEGDVIVAIDDTPINSVSELMGSVAQYNPGDVVQVTVNRDNRVKTYDVLLKNQENNTGIIKTADSFYNDLLGATLQKASGDDVRNLGISGGLKVVDVDDGILLRGGISRGFIITEINGMNVDSENTLARAINNSGKNSVSLRGMYPNGTRVSYEFML